MLARFERQMDRAQRRFHTAAGNIERRAQSLDDRLERAGARFGINLNPRIIAATAAIAALSKAINDVVRNGDRLRQIEGRFEALTGSAQRAETLLRGAFDIGANTGAPLEAITDGLTRFSIATEAIGATDEEVLKLTESIIKLGAIGGGTQEEIAAGVRQLGQGLASGRLQGDELRSVLENIPLVARQIADGLGVGVGQLREMAAAGELTAERVFQAILGKADEVDRKFKALPPSLERSAGQLANAWSKFTAELDESLGISVRLAGALSNAAEQVKGLTAGIDNAEANARDLRIITLTGEINQMEKDLAALSERARDLGFGEKLARDIAAARAEVEALLAAAERARPIRLPVASSTGGPARYRHEGTVNAPVLGPAPRLRPFELGVPDPVSTGGGGGAGISERDAEAAARMLDAIRERIQLLEQDQELAGLDAARQAELTAEFERQRIVAEFRKRVIEGGLPVTEQQIAQAEALAQRFKEESVALAVLNDVIDDEADRQREAAEAARRHEEEIRRIGDAIANAIIQADSFSDALRNVAVALANIALTRGSDIFGDLFTKGVTSLISGGTSAAPTTSLIPVPKPGFDAGGPTAGRRDEIAGFVHGEEFVVRAGPAQKHRALLERINRDGGGLPGFRAGGFVGPGSAGGGGGGMGGGTEVNVMNYGREEARVERRQGAGGREIIDVIVGELKGRMGRGEFDQPMKGRYALRPDRVKR